MPPSLVLIDLNSQASFEFQFFPTEFDTEHAANWQPQDVTSGKKPLFYSNTEPGRLTFPELWLDSTSTRESLKDTLDELHSFSLDEQEDRGAPPAMLATWGDEKFQGVMTSMRVN